AGGCRAGAPEQRVRHGQGLAQAPGAEVGASQWREREGASGVLLACLLEEVDRTLVPAVLGVVACPLEEQQGIARPESVRQLPAVRGGRGVAGRGELCCGVPWPPVRLRVLAQQRREKGLGALPGGMAVDHANVAKNHDEPDGGGSEPKFAGLAR